MNKKLIANIRVGLLVTWIVLAVAILALIQYAQIHVNVQGMVTTLVRVYLFSAFIVAGVLAWLKRKYDEISDS